VFKLNHGADKKVGSVSSLLFQTQLGELYTQSS